MFTAIKTFSKAVKRSGRIPRPSVVLGLTLALSSPAVADELTLDAAVHNGARSGKFVARDAARHPLEELSLYGVTPGSTVVEIWPGGGYWTEILAPFLHDDGTYYVALQGKGPSERDDAEAQTLNALFHDKVEADKARYGRVIQTKLGVDETEIAPASSADLVLTFRNLHNWMKHDFADQAFAAFYRTLKPGGVLGIEEHRGQRDGQQDPKAEDGYVRQDCAVALAEKAGFVHVGSSEINANPKDTANWPKGVWTLHAPTDLRARRSGQSQIRRRWRGRQLSLFHRR